MRFEKSTQGWTLIHIGSWNCVEIDQKPNKYLRQFYWQWNQTHELKKAYDCWSLKKIFTPTTVLQISMGRTHVVKAVWPSRKASSPSDINMISQILINFKYWHEKWRVIFLVIYRVQDHKEAPPGLERERTSHLLWDVGPQLGCTN